VARQSRREHRGYGRQALFAGIVLFATLIVQAACPESNLLAAGVTFLVGGTVAAVLASRVVIA
jgi:hypothetical protein